MPVNFGQECERRSLYIPDLCEFNVTSHLSKRQVKKKVKFSGMKMFLLLHFNLTWVVDTDTDQDDQIWGVTPWKIEKILMLTLIFSMFVSIVFPDH